MAVPATYWGVDPSSLNSKIMDDTVALMDDSVFTMDDAKKPTVYVPSTNWTPA